MPPIIEVEHVTKEFRLGQLTSLTQSVRNGIGRVLGRAVEERAPFRALDDVSFKVEQGEVLGIIGHNGAGKSTLLKLLAHISSPTRGRVTVRGRVAPLIEVGAGLVADMTGRENVYLNGAILGMRRDEIRRKFDEIVSFAELEEFIDTPVKRYSSGMQVRLGFAIATAVDSEILIVDEVLAVGDLAFQRKCFNRIEELLVDAGRTVLTVSHNIRQVERLCSRVLLLDHGTILMDDSPSVVCDRFYMRSNEAIAKSSSKLGSSVGRMESVEDIEFLGIDVADPAGCSLEEIPCRGSVRFTIRLHCKRPIDGATFGLGVHTTDFFYLTTHNSEAQNCRYDLPAGESSIICDVINLPLLPGIFQLRLGISSRSGATLFYGESLRQLRVISDVNSIAPASMREGVFYLDARWSQEVHSGNPESSDVNSTQMLYGGFTS